MRHTPGQHIHDTTVHLDDHIAVQIQLPLLNATLVCQLEPGIVEIVGANLVVAAEPDIQQAYTPTTSWYWK